MTAGRASLLVRSYNGAHRALALLGYQHHELDASRLLAVARRRTGLDDFGSDEFREPLRALLESIDRERALSAFGRRSMKSYVIRALEKRLEIEDWLRKHPEIREQRITRPLFIVGMPRTGSTHLHHLLSCDPAIRAPLFWQLLSPTPPPDVTRLDDDPRIARARRAVRGGLALIPELDLLHVHRADGPEECGFLFDAALMNPLIPAGHDYELWWRAQDLRPAYRYYEKQLQLLQWRWPGRYWILKAPFHLWHLDALAEVFPDARFVFTHRAPEQVVASAASYAAARSRAYFERYEPFELGRSIFDSLAGLLEVGLEKRAKLDPKRFVDVAYPRLLSEPLAVIAGIYRAFGETFDPPAQHAIERHLAENPQHKHGVHRYTAGDFGLDEKTIAERFAFYRAFCESRGVSL